MKSKWFILLAIFAMAAVTVFVTNQVTQAQRPDRGDMRERRGGRGFSPTLVIDSSWTDLTFAVKVDDKTLIDARPIYQKHRDNLEKAITAARKSGDFQAARGTMTETRDAFKADLKSVLTEKQIAQLDKLEMERMQQMMRRGGGGRR